MDWHRKRLTTIGILVFIAIIITPSVIYLFKRRAMIADFYKSPLGQACSESELKIDGLLDENDLNGARDEQQRLDSIIGESKKDRTYSRDDIARAEKISRVNRERIHREAEEYEYELLRQTVYKMMDDERFGEAKQFVENRMDLGCSPGMRKRLDGLIAEIAQREQERRQVATQVTNDRDTRSVDSPNIAGLKFVWIETGRYRVGTPIDECGRDHSIEIEPCGVRVKGYFISTTEMTQEVYSRIVPGVDWGHFTGNRIPAHSISYDEAIEFCETLSAGDAKFHYSVPTEVEWEIACRGTLNPVEGPVGVDSPRERIRFFKSVYEAKQAMKDYAYFIENKFASGPDKVGQKKPNRIKLYDVHGNVSEWCRRDDDHPAWYRNRLLGQPVRGGSVLSNYSRCRAGSRAMIPEETKKPTVGFRIIARPK